MKAADGHNCSYLCAAHAARAAAGSKTSKQLGRPGDKVVVADLGGIGMRQFAALMQKCTYVCDCRRTS